MFELEKYDICTRVFRKLFTCQKKSRIVKRNVAFSGSCARCLSLIYIQKDKIDDRKGM